MKRFLILFTLFLALASPARASEPEAPSPENWTGRFCTPQACRSQSTASHVAGFSAALLFSIWLTRRGERP